MRGRASTRSASAALSLLVSISSAQTLDPSFFSGKVYPVLESAQCRTCHVRDGVASATRLHFPVQEATPRQVQSFGLSLAPLIDPNYWDDPYDREMSLRGLELARDIMRQQALKPFVLREVLPGPSLTGPEDLTQYAWKNAKTDHHPVGTCRMGHDEMAVVTPDLKLRGMDNLRVCDA